MSTKRENKCNQKGISLIAMAFLVLVTGFILIAGIYLYQNYDLIIDDQKTVDNTREIEKAIMAFVEREGRYPCPAHLDAPIDVASYGREASTNCSTAALGTGTFRALGRDGEIVRIGTIPTRSLEISDKMMVDGYGKRYVYAVTERMASPGTDPYAEHGVISIKNTDGEDISAVEGFVIFALLSFGGDDRGAYDVDGNLLAPCDPATEAGYNCRYQTVANTEATFMTTMSKSYGTGDSAFEHSYAFHANEIPYRWDTGPWSECAGYCYEGTQDRDVACKNLNNGVSVIVADADLNDPARNPCIHTPKPEANRNCGLGPCRWRANAYGSCRSGGFRRPDTSNCD